MFKQRLIDCYTHNLHNDINVSSKCYHYKHFKSLLNVERYLFMDMPFIYKKSFSKLRCSNRKLRIEVGRHMNIIREQRIFIYCLNDSNI